MFIANFNDGRTEYNSTEKKDSSFSIKTKKLGKFFLAKDEVAPKIYKPNFTEGANLDDQQTLKISISDDLSGIASYNGYLNGKWILMEYEYKTKTLTFDFNDGIITDTKNNLKVIVTDNVGNSSTFEALFYRK